MALRVLFLCTGNSARSLMAEALLRDVGGVEFDVHSAGVEPKGVRPLTVRVLEEAGLDTHALRSKDVVEYDGQTFDYVITVCDAAAERCPAFPGAPHRIHWSTPDPATVAGTEDVRLAAFRVALSLLREKIDWFVDDPDGNYEFIGSDFDCELPDARHVVDTNPDEAIAYLVGHGVEALDAAGKLRSTGILIRNPPETDFTIAGEGLWRWFNERCIIVHTREICLLVHGG